LAALSLASSQVFGAAAQTVGGKKVVVVQPAAKTVLGKVSLIVDPPFVTSFNFDVTFDPTVLVLDSFNVLPKKPIVDPLNPEYPYALLSIDFSQLALGRILDVNGLYVGDPASLPANAELVEFLFKPLHGTVEDLPPTIVFTAGGDVGGKPDFVRGYVLPDGAVPPNPNVPGAPPPEDFTPDGPTNELLAGTTGLPEPSLAGLLGLAAPLLVRRRSR